MEGLLQTIRNLYTQYRDKPNVIEKFRSYVIDVLPMELAKYNETLDRLELPPEEITKHVMSFINNPEHQYYYILATELFVYYDGEHFRVINEDNIWHSIYTALGGLSHKMKITVKDKIIQYIKTRNMIKSIPESTTIQFVLHSLYPSILSSKEEAKYFLTILGDNIFKKNQKLIHYFDTNSKDCIKCLNEYVVDKFKNSINISHTIKWKYHSHNYNNCRILNFSKSVVSSHCWSGFIKQYTLDLICVATHYSERYNSSEDYLNKHLHEPMLKRHILYLQNKSEKILVNDFSDKMLSKDTSNNKPIVWNLIYFIWKIYLRINNYPNFVFTKDLKKYLGEIFSYTEGQNAFLHIRSQWVDSILIFQTFWKETITMDVTEKYELGELCSLYNQWLISKNDDSRALNQETMLYMIEHFFTHIEIREGKYIMNISCKLWTKQKDIIIWFTDFKNSMENYSLDLSISELYKMYCNYNKKMQNNSVSKNYFTSYIQNYVPKQFIKDNLINIDYFKN